MCILEFAAADECTVELINHLFHYPTSLAHGPPGNDTTIPRHGPLDIPFDAIWICRQSRLQSCSERFRTQPPRASALRYARGLSSFALFFLSGVTLAVIPFARQELEEDKRRKPTSAASQQQALAALAAQQAMGGNVEIQPNAQVRSSGPYSSHRRFASYSFLRDVEVFSVDKMVNLAIQTQAPMLRTDKERREWLQKELEMCSISCEFRKVLDGELAQRAEATRKLKASVMMLFFRVGMRLVILVLHKEFPLCLSLLLTARAGAGEASYLA